MGLALVVVPLALSYPQKASDATKVAVVGRVALSAKAAAGAQRANELIDGMVTQVNTQMLPTLAARLHLSRQTFETTLAQQDPAVARGLVAWGATKPGAVALVRRQTASVSDASTMNGLNFTLLPWYIMGPGIALLLTGSLALLVGPATRVRPETQMRVTHAGLS